MQIHTDGTTSAVKKMALLNNAVFGTAQANEGIVLVQHVPVVLQAGIVLG